MTELLCAACNGTGLAEPEKLCPDCEGSGGKAQPADRDPAVAEPEASSLPPEVLVASTYYTFPSSSPSVSSGGE